MPASPLDIERRFEDVQELLASGPSPRLALVALSEFLGLFASGSHRAESYLRELLPQMAQIDPLGVLGLHLDRLEHVVGILEQVRSSVSLSCAAMLEPFLAVAGEALRLTRLLVGVGEGSGTGGVPTQRRSLVLRDVTVSARLAHLSESRPEDLALGRLVRSIQSSASEASASILVVERIKWNGSQIDVGGVRRVVLRASALPSHEDQLAVDFPLAADFADEEALLGPPLTVARRMARADLPRLAGHGLVGKLSLHPAGHLHTGRSAELAIALLAYGALRRAGVGRTAFRVVPTAAFTGALLADGRVMPVDKETLAEKVTAAFFSPIDILVFPEIQRHIVMGVIDALHARYRERHLPVLGVGRVRDAMYDQRVVQTKRVPLPVHAARLAWRVRTHVVYALIVLGMAWMLWEVTRPPVDLSPVRGVQAGNEVILLNRNGKELDRINLGSRIWGSANEETFYGYELYYVLTDLNQDDVNEICWLWYQSDRDATVSCKSSGAADVLWSTPLAMSWAYKEHFGAEPRPTYPRGLVGGRFGPDGQPLLFVVVRDDGFFASAVLKIDGRNGRVLSRFVHPGWLNYVLATDVTGDGMSEIVVGGRHQAYNEPVLLVLDPRFVQGDAPSPPPYVQEGAMPAPVQWYVRFPETPLSRATRYISFNRAIVNLAIKPEGFGFMVSEGFLSRQVEAAVNQSPGTARGDQMIQEVSSTLLPHEGAQFIGLLGINMQPLWLGPSTSYDRIALFLNERGFLNEIPDRAYWDAYRDSLLYWDGDTWVAGKPVVNRHYLEALEAWNTARVGTRQPPAER